MFIIGANRPVTRSLGSASIAASACLRGHRRPVTVVVDVQSGATRTPFSLGTIGARMGYVSSTKNANGDPEVTLQLAGRTGGIALLRLNKPERLNALSMSMIRGMTEAVNEKFAQEHQLESLEAKGPKLLVLVGAGGRAFCAGGDVKAVAMDKSLGPGEAGTLRSDFFSEEYRLDYRLAQIAKEKALMSIWDGVVMGGGVGISIHGSFRVATETTLFAMPETVIGLFPDVGTAYVLSRLPGGLGHYLGLTGTRLRAGDLLHCGLATHLVKRDRLDELQAALFEDDGRDPDTVLEAFGTEGFPAQSHLARDRQWIDEAFKGARDVEEIIRRLEARLAGHTSLKSDPDRSAQEWAQGTLSTLRKASPTALKVTHRHIAWAADKDLRECFQQDFRVMQHMMETFDFEEGVRALLIDKDNKPAWHPLTVEGVSESDVEALFKGIGEHELDVTGTP